MQREISRREKKTASLPRRGCIKIHRLHLPASALMKNYGLSTADDPAQVAQGRALHNSEVRSDWADREHVIDQHRRKATFHSGTRGALKVKVAPTSITKHLFVQHQSTTPG